MSRPRYGHSPSAHYIASSVVSHIDQPRSHPLEAVPPVGRPVHGVRSTHIQITTATDVSMQIIKIRLSSRRLAIFSVVLMADFAHARAVAVITPTTLLPHAKVTAALIYFQDAMLGFVRWQMIARRNCDDARIWARWK